MANTTYDGDTREAGSLHTGTGMGYLDLPVLVSKLEKAARQLRWVDSWSDCRHAPHASVAQVDGHLQQAVKAVDEVYAELNGATTGT